MVRVFISWRHEGPEHEARVRLLGTRLREAGIEVELDLFAQAERFNMGGPAEGWPAWSSRAAASGKVVVVGSAGWFRVFDGQEAPGLGNGTASEARVLRQRLYEAGSTNPDIRVLLAPGVAPLTIPIDLRPDHHFTDSPTLADVLSWLRGQPPPTVAPSPPAWPADPPTFDWPIANHHEVREAVASLLTAGSTARLLRVWGTSGAGKTTIAMRILANARRLPWLHAGRLDCKGTGGLTAEMTTLAMFLGLSRPSGGTLGEQLGVLIAAICSRKEPSLLVVDTFEVAPDDLREWLINLSFLLQRHDCLRVVVLGQAVTIEALAAAGDLAPRPLVLACPTAEQWYEHAVRDCGFSEPIEFLRTVHRLAQGNAVTLGSIIPGRPMNPTALLAALATAGHDPAAQALVMVDFVFADRDVTVREAMKDALKAASVPHWFDEALCAAMLPGRDPKAVLADLRRLSCVETFRARGDHAVNVHEATRLAMRRWLAEHEPERRRQWARAAHDALDRTQSYAQTEALFLSFDLGEDAVLAAWEAREDALGRSGRHYERDADVRVVDEVDAEGPLRGNERAVALVVRGWARNERGLLAGYTVEADEAVGLAEERHRLVAEAQHLCGAVGETVGNTTGALESFETYLAISARLAASDPTSVGWQRELALAHSRVGGVQQASGDLAGARVSFEAYLAISARLAASDPTNTGWQRGLALAHGRVGDVRQASGDLAGARESFDAYLAISVRLAASDPTSAGWERDLAVAHSRVGDVRKASGDLVGAREAFEAELAISARLAASDPTNAGWQRELAVAHSNVGDVRKASGDLAGARASFQASLAISVRLAASDPTNAGWQRGLALAHGRVGDVRQVSGDLEGARESFEAYLAISARLAASDPTNAGWQRDIAVAHSKVGDVRQASGDLVGAREAFEAYLAISARLAASDPTNAGWERELAVAHSKVGDVRKASGDLAGARESFQADLTISAKLAASDPTNAGWQRDLAVTHSLVGDVCRESGDLAGAGESFEASLAISARLAAADPANAEWRRGLALAHLRLARVSTGHTAARHWEQAEYAMRAALKRSPGRADWEAELAAIRREAKAAQRRR